MVELKVEYTEVEVKFGIFSSDPKRFILKHFCNNLQLFIAVCCMIWITVQASILS